jgi:hypothetical protein
VFSAGRVLIHIPSGTEVHVDDTSVEIDHGLDSVSRVEEHIEETIITVHETLETAAPWR